MNFKDNPLLNRLYVFAKENQLALLCLFLFFLTWQAFIPCIRNAFSNYDDYEYVLNNNHVLSGLHLTSVIWAFSSVTSANWHPVTMLSHIVDAQLYGRHPWGHHLTSVIIHSINTMLVFLLLQQTTQAIWRSFWTAALFGVHPLRVESVAWISERKDVLSMLFFLLAAIAYAKYAAGRASATPKAGRYYGVALLLFFCGLMCKPMLVTFPFVLLLIDFWPLERFKREGIIFLAREKVPFLAITVLFSFITCFTQRLAMPSVNYIPLSARFENMPVSYVRYLGKIFYPVGLSVFYPYPVHWPVLQVILSVALLLGISAIILLKAPHRPYVFVGWCWFLGVLFPVIGLTQAGVQSMADRYSYIPSLGVSIACVWLLCEFAVNSRPAMIVLWAGAILTTATCVLLTRQQISYWKTGDTLWRHAALVTKNNYVAYAIIGLDDLTHTNYDAAVTNLQRALQIQFGMETRIHRALGLALLKDGHFTDAVETLRGVVLKEPTNATNYEEFATALAATGRRNEAVTNLLYAIKLHPHFEEAEQQLEKLTNAVPLISCQIKQNEKH